MLSTNAGNHRAGRCTCLARPVRDAMIPGDLPTPDMARSAPGPRRPPPRDPRRTVRTRRGRRPGPGTDGEWRRRRTWHARPAGGRPAPRQGREGQPRHPTATRPLACAGALCATAPSRRPPPSMGGLPWSRTQGHPPRAGRRSWRSRRRSSPWTTPASPRHHRRPCLSRHRGEPAAHLRHRAGWPGLVLGTRLGRGKAWCWRSNDTGSLGITLRGAWAACSSPRGCRCAPGPARRASPRACAWPA